MKYTNFYLQRKSMEILREIGFEQIYLKKAELYEITDETGLTVCYGQDLEALYQNLDDKIQDVAASKKYDTLKESIDKDVLLSNEEPAEDLEDIYQSWYVERHKMLMVLFS